MSKPITLLLQADDAEPILRQAAFEAAKYSAWCDYLTPGTRTSFSFNRDDRSKWQSKFLRAKRLVEAFGIEYQPTSEEEALTITFDYVGGKTRIMNVPGIGRIRRTMATDQLDYKHPRPSYRGEVHSQACHAAAERVIRAWRQSLKS